MQQEDDDILTPQKPSKSNVPSLPGDESTKHAYMLSRYVSYVPNLLSRLCLVCTHRTFPDAHGPSFTYAHASQR